MFNEFVDAVCTIVKSDDIHEIAKDGAQNLLVAVITKDPASCIGSIKNMKDLIFSIPNIIYADKMYRFLTKAFSDYDAQLKFSELFNSDNKKFKATVKIQLQILEKIEFDEKVVWFANLTKAVCMEHISVDKYLMLAKSLSMILSDDLEFLKELYVGKDKEENSTLSTLYAYGLAEKWTPTTPGSITAKYNISDDGVEMLRCGIDFDNYTSYELRGKPNET